MQALERRRRRRYTPAFKAAAVAACEKPSASVAGVALELQLNANMLRMWIKHSRAAALPFEGPASTTAFLPVPLSGPSRLMSTPSISLPPSPTERPIRVQIHEGSARITIEWPTSAASACDLPVFFGPSVIWPWLRLNRLNFSGHLRS
jgi:transposase